MKKTNSILPTKQLRVNLMDMLSLIGGKNERLLTCTAKAVFPTPPSPRTATLQLSIPVANLRAASR